MPTKFPTENIIIAVESYLRTLPKIDADDSQVKLL